MSAMSDTTATGTANTTGSASTTTGRAPRPLALAAAGLAAAGTLAGAGTASAQPGISPTATQYAEPNARIGNPWTLGEVPLYYGNGPVCAGGVNEEIHITFTDARREPTASLSDPTSILPGSFVVDVDWHNQDTGQSGTDHAEGYRFEGWSHFRPGVGRVTGTVKATASILPGGGSVEGVGSHSISMPFETTVPSCKK